VKGLFDGYQAFAIGEVPKFWFIVPLRQSSPRRAFGWFLDYTSFFPTIGAWLIDMTSCKMTADHVFLVGCGNCRRVVATATSLEQIQLAP
jgi:hypothetical protein